MYVFNVSLLYKILSLLKSYLEPLVKNIWNWRGWARMGELCSVFAENVILVEVIKFYLQIKAISLIMFLFFFVLYMHTRVSFYISIFSWLFLFVLPFNVTCHVFSWRDTMNSSNFIPFVTNSLLFVQCMYNNNTIIY